MKVAELKRLCDEQGLEYGSNVKKAELVRLLERYAEPIEVEAQVVDDEMIPVKPFAIDMTKVNEGIGDLTDAIDNVLTVYGEMEVEDEVIADMQTDDLVSCEKALSDALDEADEIRKQLGRDYRKPLDEANARYKELTAPAYALRDKFQEQRKSNRRNGLERTYIDFCESNGMSKLPQLVPFQRLLDRNTRWMAINSNAGTAAQNVEKTAKSIIDDWGTLSEQRASMRFYDEAEAEFFKTLDLSAAIRLNQERTAVHEQLEAARAEREAVEAWRKSMQTPRFVEVEPEPPVQETVQAHEPAAGVVHDEPSVAVDVRKPYVIFLDMTDSEKQKFKKFIADERIGIQGQRYVAPCADRDEAIATVRNLMEVNHG